MPLDLQNQHQQEHVVLDNEEKPLNESIKSLLRDTEISDIFLESSDNVSIPALKCILSCRSSVFRQLLYGGFMESSASRINLGFDSVVLYSIVEYCYTDDISLRHSACCDDNWCRNVIRLIVAADYFGFTKLVRKLQNLSFSKMYQIPTLACAFMDEMEQIMSGNDGDCCEVFADLKKRALGVIRWNGGASLVPNSSDNTGVLSLQSYTLEKVLNEEELCADEFTLFQALKIWRDGDGDRQILASKMSSHLHLERIKPSVLCNTIALSNLVSSTQLLEAFKTQALLAEDNKLVTDQMRYRGKVQVKLAGVPEINGDYFPCGLSDGVPKYQRKTIWEGQDTIFTLFRWEHDNWYIAIVPEYDPANKDDTNIDFYKSPANTGPINCEYPPHVWKTIHEMDDPPPLISTILHNGSIFNDRATYPLQTNGSSDTMDCYQYIDSDMNDGDNNTPEVVTDVDDDCSTSSGLVD